MCTCIMCEISVGKSLPPVLSTTDIALSCPLKKRAGLRHFYSGFTFQTNVALTSCRQFEFLTEIWVCQCVHQLVALEPL